MKINVSVEVPDDGGTVECIETESEFGCVLGEAK